MKKFIILLSAMAVAAAKPCVERNLAHFYDHGREIAPEVVGADDPCDDFGGAGVYTPKYHVWVYVNFNIPARLDVAEVDRSLDNLPPNYRAFFLRVQNIAVVDDKFMKKWFRDKKKKITPEASLNWAGDTLFVSAKAVARPREFNHLLQRFYSLDQ